MDAKGKRRASIRSPCAGGLISNAVPFAVDTLPEALEKEPNDTPATAQRVKLPVIVNGRIDQPGDWDVFRFEGRAGQAIVAEVYARRLGFAARFRAAADRRRRQAAGLQRRLRRQGRGLEHAPRRFADLLATLPATATYYLHSATPSTRAARSTPTVCASARRGRISSCA